MNKKGVFFSVDALIALAIIILVIVIAVPLISPPEYKSNLHYDILDVISSLKTGEVATLPFNLKPDPERTVLDQMGEFYATGNISLARELAKYVLDDIETKDNIGLWFENTLIWSKNSTEYEENQQENIDTARQIISGIQNGSSVRGFSARAFLAQSNPKKYSYFGGYVGDGNLTLETTYYGEIEDAELEIAIPKPFELYINNNSAGVYPASPDAFTPITYILNESTLAYFNSGTNTIEFKGENLYIAGGFLKIDFASNTTQGQSNRYNFPGIEGIINLYDGFYVPGELQSMEIYLHMNNTIAPTFLNLGNTKVYNNLTNDEEYITLDNTFLSGILDYNSLSEETIPLRLGMENISYLQNGTQRSADVFSVTDLSGSMCGQCINGGFWCGWLYDYNQPQCLSCGGICQETAIDDAKEANELFVDIILNSTGNKVGLVGYASDAPASDYHELSDDSTSLHNKISDWQAVGGTCICCGILEATDKMVAQSENDIKSMVVMSDGQANIGCGMNPVDDHDLDGDTSDDPQDQAIEAACIAYSDNNITVHAVGFGSDIDSQTLQDIAQCGNGTYYFADVGNLSETYENIAQDLLESFYVEQTVEFTESIYTKLYPDSYIEFNYSSTNPTPFGLVLTNEVQFLNSTTGNFSIPENSTAIEARITSYSGPRWTSTVKANNNLVYNLSTYSSEFISLGDPYTINIPPALITPGVDHEVILTTGLSPNNQSEGSPYNKIIYTFAKEISSFSDIYGFAEGCIWTIQFEDLTNLTSVPIPDTYNGTEECYFNLENGAVITRPEDAYQVATRNILDQLDFDNDNLIDIKFSEQGLKITLTIIQGIPYTWSTEVQARIWS